MKKIVQLSLVFLLLLLSCKETKKTEAPNEQVIALEAVTNLYEDLEGNQVALENFIGKRVVLNYWATWCKPCIEEMPAMARAQELLKDDNYVFLFASDQSVEKIAAFKAERKFGIHFIKFNGAYADLEITALPVTLIYNTKGKQVERIDGGVIWDAPSQISKLKKLN